MYVTNNYSSVIVQYYSPRTSESGRLRGRPDACCALPLAIIVRC